MNKLKSRALYVVKGTDGRGEDGASNLEIIVWMVVVLGIAALLWKFRDAVIELISNVTSDIGKWDVNSGWTKPGAGS